MIEIGAEETVTRFSREDAPIARIKPGDLVRVATSDAAYATLTGDALDRGRVSTSQLNVITGPIYIDGAKPGDSVRIEIEQIDLGERAFAVYVGRWRQRTFGVAGSRVTQVRIVDGTVVTDGGRRIPLSPMVGCIGVAPAGEPLSTLSPTGRTGGNLDLVEMRAGSTVWLPVEVDGALLSLGDLHAAMGRGEPTGSGLECGGRVTLRIGLEAGGATDGPRILTADEVVFVGTDPDDVAAAQAQAVRAAWSWLTDGCGVPVHEALVACAGILAVNTAGPAGANAAAAFKRSDLRAIGIVDHEPVLGAAPARDDRL